jgi:hypothetical protein
MHVSIAVVKRVQRRVGLKDLGVGFSGIGLRVFGPLCRDEGFRLLPV